MPRETSAGGPFLHPAKSKTFEIGQDGMSGDSRGFHVLEIEKKVIRRLPPYQFKSEDPVDEIKQGIAVFAEFDSYEHLHIPNFHVIQAAISDEDTLKPFLFVVDM